MDFLQELNESKMFSSSKALKKYDARNITDMTLMYFAALCILKNEFLFAPIAARYARQTLMAKNWEDMPFRSNDLSVLIHTVNGQSKEANASRDNLKNQAASKMLLKRVGIKTNDAAKFLTHVMTNKKDDKFDSRFMLALERSLAIQNSNYRSVRRLAQDWHSLDTDEKRLALTRMLHFFRARAPRSELRIHLERLAKAQKLEIRKAKKTEKKR